jgi:cytochrome c oxidase assembly protein subunit 15
MNARIERLRARRTVSPRAHEIVSWLALTFLTLIVMSGAGVRLTGSGLGCKEWPKCTDQSITPVDGHAYIEYGNRLMTTPVLLFCGLALVFALLRNPYRRDFVRIAGALVIGVLIQAVLGGITVLTGLNPLIVSGHFLISMSTLSLGVLLVWRVRRERLGLTERPQFDADLTWSVRLLVAMGAVVVFVGTLVTASGPHSGGEGTGDDVNRLKIFGSGTFRDLIATHARVATVFGVVTIGVFVFAYVRRAGKELLVPLAAVSILTGVAGLIGHLQYHVFAYPEGLVWVHVIVVSMLWNALSWSLISSGLGEKAQVPDAKRPKGRSKTPDLVAS